MYAESWKCKQTCNKKPKSDKRLISFFYQNDLFAQCKTERLSVITGGIQKTNVLLSYCFYVSMSCRGQFVMV